MGRPVDIIKILRETRAGNTGPFDDQCFPAVFAGFIPRMGILASGSRKSLTQIWQCLRKKAAWDPGEPWGQGPGSHHHARCRRLPRWAWLGAWPASTNLVEEPNFLHGSATRSHAIVDVPASAAGRLYPAICSLNSSAPSATMAAPVGVISSPL